MTSCINFPNFKSIKNIIEIEIIYDKIQEYSIFKFRSDKLLTLNNQFRQETRAVKAQKSYTIYLKWQTTRYLLKM